MTAKAFLSATSNRHRRRGGRLGALPNILVCQSARSRQAGGPGDRPAIPAAGNRSRSQECPKCQYVDRGNRAAQETFECLDCGFTGPADTVAACNTQFRVLADVPRGKNALLHTFDAYGRAVPKPMARLRLKGIVERKLYPPVSPGHFTEPLGPGSTNKVGARTPVFVKVEAPTHSL